MALRTASSMLALALCGVALQADAGYITTLHPVTFVGVPVHFSAVGPWADESLLHEGQPFVPNRYRWDVQGDGTWDATTTEPELSMALPAGGVWAPRVEAAEMVGISANRWAIGAPLHADGSPLRVDTTAGALPIGFLNSAPIAGIGGLTPCYYDPSIVRCINVARGHSVVVDGAPSHDPNENVGDYIDRYYWRDWFSNQILAASLNEQATLAPEDHAWLGAHGDRLIRLQVTDAFGAFSGFDWAVLVVRDAAQVSVPSTLSLAALAGLLGFAARRARRRAADVALVALRPERGDDRL